MKITDYSGYHKYRNNDMSQEDLQLPQYFIKMLPKDKNISVLDIGCGNGNVLYALKKRGYNKLQGIDLDPYAVNCCRKIGILCEQVDILEFRGGRYDFVMMNHVLEHLPKENIISILSYIRENLLTNTGKLFIRVPNGQAYTGCYWAYEDFTHNLLFTAGSLQFVLRCAGFNQIQLIDQYGLKSGRWYFRPVKALFVFLYAKKIDFWNHMLGCSFHKPSPRVYTWEVKMIAEK